MAETADIPIEKMSLAAKIARISAEIGAVDKSGRNAQQGYAFIESAQVAAEVRVIQAKYGVTVIPSVESCTVDQVRSPKGGIGFHYVLNMMFRIINAHDPSDTIEAKWLGEATDYSDKGINKAETSSEKYFLMKLYHISEKDKKNDDEADAHTPEMKDVVKEQKIDFKFLTKVRGRLPLLNSVQALEEYWKELKLSPKHQSLLKKDFAKRKEELNGME